MGTHCTHVEDPRGSACVVFYRDITDNTRDRIREKLRMTTLGGCTQICGSENNWDMHWKASEKSVKLGGNSASIVFLSKGIIYYGRWMTPLWFGYMGTHCTHVEDPRGSACVVFYRDITDNTRDRIREKLRMTTLGGCTQICGSENNWDMHWKASEKSVKLGGNSASIVFLSKGIIYYGRWMTKVKIVGPSSTTI